MTAPIDPHLPKIIDHLLSPKICGRWQKIRAMIDETDQELAESRRKTFNKLNNDIAEMITSETL